MALFDLSFIDEVAVSDAITIELVSLEPQLEDIARRAAEWRELLENRRLEAMLAFREGAGGELFEAEAPHQNRLLGARQPPHHEGEREPAKHGSQLRLSEGRRSVRPGS